MDDSKKKRWVLAKYFRSVFYCPFIIVIPIRKTNIAPLYLRIISLAIQSLINTVANIEGREIH